jgi:hypothetical protein
MTSTSARDRTRVGLLRRAAQRLGSGPAAHEAKELRDEATKVGCSAIDSSEDRDVVLLHGTLRAVTLRPRGGVSALEAELYDGSATVTLVWLGRRRIAGIQPGSRLTVHGRLSCQDGKRVLYNPRYELTA